MFAINLWLPLECSLILSNFLSEIGLWFWLYVLFTILFSSCLKVNTCGNHWVVQTITPCIQYEQLVAPTVSCVKHCFWNFISLLLRTYPGSVFDIVGWLTGSSSGYLPFKKISHLQSPEVLLWETFGNPGWPGVIWVSQYQIVSMKSCFFTVEY